MASEIRANSITSRAGLSTVTMTDSGPMFSGITTFVDNSGFTFGVGGGTSIFTPATNILTLGTNNTEKVRIDANGNTNITGVTTAANFKTGVSNLHDVGLTLSGGQIDVGSNIKIGNAGVVTATSFVGSGANLTGIDTDLVADTSPQLGGDLDTNSYEIFLDAGHSLKLATNQGQIYHSGSQMYIGTNDLRITNYAVNETMAKFVADGAVELYHNDSKKIETTSGGVSVTGGINLTTNLSLLDNGYLKLGTGDDLQLYHSSNSIIQNNNNGVNLILQSDYMTFRANSDTSEDFIKCVKDGAVELYHNDTHMLSTASDGIQLQTDRRISRHPNSNSTVLQVTNASYAKSLYIGGWDSGTNSSGISRIRNSNDNLHLDSGSLGTIYLNAYASGVIYARHFRPMSDNTFDLGGSGIRWDDIFATNGTINTSDRNEKNTITESDLGLSFISKLKPVSYKFNNGTRTHYGLIAQDIETVLSDISKPSTDFAGFIKTDLPDEYYQEAEPNIPEGKKEGDLKSAAHTKYALRYTEFISPLIKAIQEQQEQIKTLEQDNIALRVRVTNLEGN